MTDDDASQVTSTLRGAGVDVDPRRAGRAVLVLCVAALVVSGVLLLWAGAHKNAQITRLRHQGTTVEATITRCLGLLGGSGSNGAGYTCRGTFTLHGRHYQEAIPGDTLYASGTNVPIVAAPGNPPLIATPHQVATERASGRVFIVPAVLLAAAVVIAGAVELRRRARHT